MRTVDVRVLMLTSYPPMRGGIAAYSAQSVVALRRDGHEVVVASPEPSDADRVIDVRRRGAGFRLARLARQCERLVVQFQPEMLGAPGTSARGRAQALLRLAAGLWAAPSSEVCVHEMDYGEQLRARIFRAFARPIWKLANQFTVHTEGERQDFAAAFGIDEERIRVVSQAAHLLRRTDADRATARASLGLPVDPVILLAIGFLQPHKGFDRAIRAFAGLDAGQARLYVVGSVWRDDATSRSHLAELRRLAAETPGAELREVYLSDEEFDRWIVAADALVLPYRLGWSSNVMERGMLYDRAVIMSRVGGMVEQGADRAGVTLVEDDSGLRDVLRQAVRELPTAR